MMTHIGQDRNIPVRTSSHTEWTVARVDRWRVVVNYVQGQCRGRTLVLLSFVSL